VKQYLELLINLQEIDSQIERHNNQVTEIWRKKEALEQEWLKFQQGLERLKNSLEENQKQRRRYERDLEAKEGEAKRYKGQLLNVKTNREYQSLLHEIERAKNDSEQLEEEILKLMEAGDELQQQIRDYQQKLGEEQKRIGQQQQELTTLLNKCQQEKDDLLKEREQLKQGLEANLLADYEKLIHSRGGIALTLAKDGVCQSCFIRLTPQTYEEIKKREKIYHCPNCFRMLYTEGA
jgi:hypothetical protein